MKKLLLSLFAAMFVVVLVAGVSFAAGKKMTGKVKSIDMKKGEIVFCPSGTKEEIPMKVDPKMLEEKKIKAGTAVDITVDEKDAKSVTKIKKAATIPVGC